MTDSFQIRAWAKFLDYARASSRGSDAKHMLDIFEIKDAEPSVVDSLNQSFKLLDSDSETARELFSEAFFTHASLNDDYSGNARCFVNPPSAIKCSGQCRCDISSSRRSSSPVINLHRFDPKAVKLRLSSMSGDEKGFFNEVVIFNGGLITDSSLVSALVTILAPHICPAVTVLIFDTPTASNGVVMSLFDLDPKKEMDQIICGLGSATGFSFDHIEDKDRGLRTMSYFGVVA